MSNENNEKNNYQNNNLNNDNDDSPTEIYDVENDPYTMNFDKNQENDTEYIDNKNETPPLREYYQNYPETRELQPVQNNAESYRDPNSYDSDEDYINTLEDFYIENLPSEDIDGSGEWIYKDRYQKLLYEAGVINHSNAIMGKNYDQIINSNSILKNEKKNLEQDLETSKKNEEAAQRASRSKEISINKREEELESQKNKDKTLKIVLIVSLILASILAVVFGFLWNSSRSNTESISGTSSAQEKQINDLNAALQSERESKSSIEQQKNELQGRIDDLTTQINEANKSRDDLQNQLDKRNEELKELSQRIDEIGELEAETVTQTLPPEVQTITREPDSPPVETVYQTVTEEATDSSPLEP